MTVTPATALSTLPAGLRDPLLAEYQQIVQNYFDGKWLPSELYGGRFCEIVYTILDGHAKGKYAVSTSKPSNFVQACRNLENNSGVPRSFQILIPRLLPALYEIRNNRNVGHVGGDVDSNHMDATSVIAMANWIMAELVRVFHSLPIPDAQQLVDQLAERRVPLIWQNGDMKRVLSTRLTVPDQVLILISSCASGCLLNDLVKWTDYFKNPSYIKRIVQGHHSRRLVEFTESSDSVQILPPGSDCVRGLLCQLKK